MQKSLNSRLRNLPPNLRSLIETAAQPNRNDFSRYADDPISFNLDALGNNTPDGLGNVGFWSRQEEICQSVVKNRITLAKTGNMVGKTRAAARILEWFLQSHRNSMVLATAPGQVQLEEVLWKEVETVHRNARVPLSGRLLKNPLKIEIAPDWHALAYSTTKVERFSGHHQYDLLGIGDEASGISNEIKEAFASLGCSRELWIGNPLRPDGWFYDACQSAPTNRLANLIEISSLESPHIHLERSPWGLADATWLETARNDYGEDSIWWKSHVLGQFPDSAAESLLKISWLDAAILAVHRPGGFVRTSIDIGEGNGGDKSVVLTRDDNGILACEASNTWSFEATAGVAARHVQRYGVESHRVTFDVGGIGADFANRLLAVGLVGCRAYRGGGGGGKAYGNLRSKAAWTLRQRLDPHRMLRTMTGVMLPQVPFAIRPDLMRPMRPELQGLHWKPGDIGDIQLELKEDYAKRLKHSPDYADALIQSFAFSD